MSRNQVVPGAQRHAAPHARTSRRRGGVLARAPLLVLMGLGAIALLMQAVRATPAPVQLGLPLLAHITGLLAGYGVALMLALMSRDLRHHDVYLCASPGLSSAMRAALYGAGLPHRQLHEEVFSF